MKQGEFNTYADGADKRIQFNLSNIQRQLPQNMIKYSQDDLEANFDKIYFEAKSILILKDY